MAGIKPLAKTNELATNRLTSARPRGAARRIYEFHYDDLTDAVMILLVQPQEAVVVHYLDDHVGFLYEEDSLEIVGLRIDAFEKVFLPANQAIQRLWLNIHSDELKDFGQLTIMLERTQPEVVKAVVRATRSLLGPPGAKFATFAGV
jgi:hypothetical protein